MFDKGRYNNKKYFLEGSEGESELSSTAELSSTRGQNSCLPKSLNSRLPKSTELSSTEDRTLVYHKFIFLKALKPIA